MSELAVKHRDKVKLMDAPIGFENVQIILEAIAIQNGIECDYEVNLKSWTQHLQFICEEEH